MKIKSLRKKYPKFVFQNYSYKISNTNLEILFDFKIEPDIIFKPKVVIAGISKSRIEKIGKQVLDNLAFHLGLIEVLSYWKATCSPEIEIQAGKLDRDMIAWWKDLIVNGMGQFFYENKINWKGSEFLKISSKRKGNNSLKVFNKKLKDKLLIPVGGGKDSALTLAILEKEKKNIQCFSLNPTGSATKVMEIGECSNPIIVKRKIDPMLLELNRKGFLNGHTPFSAYIAFLSVLIAVIFDKKYIVLSNERSSNEGNVIYLGKEINHQYSKSFDFEKKFRRYSNKYLAEDVEYFSFLRPLYEIQIAKLFSKHPEYFKAFLSCNEAYKTNSGTKKKIGKWCCNCPKCLFVFACLYPFIGKQEMLRIFGENLFEKKELLCLMKELIGEKSFKPFECVGTQKESLAAFYLSWKKSESIGEKPYLLRWFEKNILIKHPKLEKEVKEIMDSWNNKHRLPEEFLKILMY